MGKVISHIIPYICLRRLHQKEGQILYVFQSKNVYDIIIVFTEQLPQSRLIAWNIFAILCKVTIKYP